MKIQYIMALFAVLLMVSLAFGDARSGFDEGLRLYRSGDMQGAISAWESVLRQGEVSGALYYNLGNAYYREKKFGQAILSYERARKLEPRDRDIVANLDLTRLATVDRIEPPVHLIIWKWVDSVRDHFALGEIADLFYILGFIVAGLLLLFKLGPTRYRAAFRSLMSAVLILYVLTGGWYLWRARLDGTPFAVVMTEKTDAYSAPDEASKQLFSLHEGTKVQCGENLSGWINVRLADGRKGWIPVQSVERI
jgi:tetratricopeptide (TPR) repeat protein